MNTLQRLGTLAIAALGVEGCQGDTPRPPVQFELAEAAAFAGHSGGRSYRAFDIVAADMDVDGDDDLLINWHHLGPMELFENTGGLFELVNARGGDRSGLYDNRGVPSLFASPGEMRRRLEAENGAGLYVWHDLDRRGSWRFVWRPPAGQSGRALLDLETSLGFEELEGLDDQDVLERSARILRLALAPASGHGSRDRGQVFRLRTEQVTIGLELFLRSPEGEPLPIIVGPDLTPRPGGTVELWKPDPHGIAWVDVEDDERPEIYITRGALIGQLSPPRRAKRERYFLPVGGALYELAPAGTMPRDRGRGRRVEWVDVDNDGRLDLSVASESSANRLLMRSGTTQSFRDRAADYGLDLTGGAVESWGDYDGDGRQDVYVLADRAIDILMNRGDRPFEKLRGDSVGLDLPPSYLSAETQFDFSSIRLADFDSDGDLDIWLLSSGGDRSNFLFRRDASSFTDISHQVGLDRLRGNIFATLCDFDNDGFEDVISSGWLDTESREESEAGSGQALLWHNQAGESFSFVRLGASVAPQPIHAATCLDANTDGRPDVAAVGIERNLLRNVSPTAGHFVDVVPREGEMESIGAVVKLYYSTARVVARRYGSARSSAFSQSLSPLHFGVPDGVGVERLTVHWPGDAEESDYPPPDLDRTTIIRRAGPGRAPHSLRPGAGTETRPYVG